MSATGSMTTDRRPEGVALGGKPPTRRNAFWRGVLEGFSGPALMANQPKIIPDMVAISGGRIRLTWPLARRLDDRRVAHEGGTTVARELSNATEVVMAQNGLVLSQDLGKRLDRDGKIKQHKRPHVRSIREDASK